MNPEEVLMKRLAHISYHVIVVLMSAALALSVPFALSSMASGMLRAWAYIENEKIFLIALELLTAVVLILFFNHMKRGWEDRRIARMAKSIGLVLATTAKGIFAQRKIKKLKRKLGFARGAALLSSPREICMTPYRAAAKQRSCCSIHLKRGQ
jgi:hypothetical protein